MDINEIKKDEVINVLRECKTKMDFLRKFGYKNNGSGYRFIEKVIKHFDINIYDYIDKKITEEDYNNKPLYCKYCGKKLSYQQRDNKFCSKSCSASYNNFNRTRSIESRLKTSNTLSQKNKKELKTCKQCGKLFIGNKDFCCNKCKNEFDEKNKIKRWLNGENFLRGATQIPLFIRKYLMNKYDCKCQKCGWGEMNQYTHTIQLEIHHKDGNCTNNTINNLELLCPNCHTLTDNFGSLNKKSYRFHRNRITLQDDK